MLSSRIRRALLVKTAPARTRGVTTPTCYPPRDFLLVSLRRPLGYGLHHFVAFQLIECAYCPAYGAASFHYDVGLLAFVPVRYTQTDPSAMATAFRRSLQEHARTTILVRLTASHTERHISVYTASDHEQVGRSLFVREGRNAQSTGCGPRGQLAASSPKRLAQD